MDKKTKRKLAVFDIDGTVFRSSLTRRLFSQLIKDGVFPKRAEAEVRPEFRSWLNRRGSYDDYIAKVVRVFMKYIKGKRQKDLVAASREVIAEEKSRVYRFTRDLIKDLKKKKYFLLAICGSPYEIVRLYNRSLKFDKSYGWVLEVDEKGRYTGKHQYLYSVRDKKFLVDRVLKKYNLTLEGSIGVGDSEADASFLQMMKRPIAFNPSSGLYKEAKKRSWEVVVERKDVIYRL